jgi:Spy/CpxP family protein refolding chaperone
MGRKVLFGSLLAVAMSATAAMEFPAPPPAPPVPGHFLVAPHFPGSPMGGGLLMNLVMLAEELDLTPEQRKKAGEIMDRAAPKLRELMFRMVDNRKALNELATKDVDDRELRRLTKEQGEIVSGMTYLHLRSRADLRALLTAGQREKLDEIRGGHFRTFGRVHGPLAAPPEAMQFL